MPSLTLADVCKQLGYGDATQLSRQQKLRILEVLRGMASAPTSASAAVSREDPRDFIVDVLGEVPTPAALSHKIKVPWTPDQDRIMQSVLDNRRTLAQSANSVGKTAIAARIALWWLYRHPKSIVITTAPNARQVEILLWGQLRETWGNSKTKLPGRMLLTKLSVDEKAENRWMAIGFTANVKSGEVSSTQFSGLHGPYMLAIMDESTAINVEIRDAIEGMLVGPEDRILALGNPTIRGSWFHHASMSSSWNRVIIDAENHPNVVYDDAQIIPGAVSRVWVEDRREEWGEESALWQVKVKGQWPNEDNDTLIRMEWLASAQARWEERPDDAPGDKKGVAAGLDIADEGGDLTVLSTIENGSWQIPMVNGKRSFHSGKDVLQATQLVLDALAEGIKIRILTLDDTGIGRAVYRDLQRLKREGKVPYDLWVIQANFGAVAWKNEQFPTIRDQLWWDAREVFRERDFLFPSDDEILTWGLPKGSNPSAQVKCPFYEQVRGGKIQVYDKRGRGGPTDKIREKIKTLPEKSPDVAHSFILCVHSWLKLRADETPPPPETTLDIFTQKVRKMIESSRVGSKNRPGAAPPWMKGAGSH